MSNREKLEEARIRLAATAYGLANKFPPLEVARMFQGCVLGILTNAFGLAAAKDFVAQFAQEVAGEDVPTEWPPVGHA